MALTLAFVLYSGFAYRAVPFNDSSNFNIADLPRYEAYRPLDDEVRKHIVVGSCDISLPLIGNDLRLPDRPSKTGRPAWYGNVLNAVLRNEYTAAGKLAFFDISGPNTVMSHHTLYLYHALKTKNLKTILYVNGLGVGHFGQLDERQALELMAVLEALRVAYPGARTEIGAYLSLVAGSTPYKRGVEHYGTAWRQLIDPETKVFKVPYGDARPFLARARSTAAHLKAVLAIWLAGIPEVMIEPLQDLFGFRDRTRDLAVREGLKWLEQFYGRPENQAPVRNIAESDFLLSAETRNANIVWLRMVAALAREKKAKLVFYIQPMLAILPSTYREHFRPGYSETIRKWLADENVVVIDQTIAHPLTQQDFVQECQGGVCKTVGYYANLMGRIKQARLLIDAMIAKGLIEAKPTTGHVWRDETGLPQVRRCIRVFGAGNDDCVDGFGS